MSGVVSPSRTRILVVEDDPATRVLYSSALKNAGYSVAAVEDGVDALKTFDVGRIPDAVVLDLGTAANEFVGATDVSVGNGRWAFRAGGSGQRNGDVEEPQGEVPVLLADEHAPVVRDHFQRVGGDL